MRVLEICCCSLFDPPLLIVIAADTESAFYDELLEMDSGIAVGGILLQAAETRRLKMPFSWRNFARK